MCVDFCRKQGGRQEIILRINGRHLVLFDVANQTINTLYHFENSNVPDLDVSLNDCEVKYFAQNSKFLVRKTGLKKEIKTREHNKKDEASRKKDEEWMPLGIFDAEKDAPGMEKNPVKGRTKLYLSESKGESQLEMKSIKFWVSAPNQDKSLIQENVLPKYSPDKEQGRERLEFGSPEKPQQVPHVHPHVGDGITPINESIFYSDLAVLKKIEYNTDNDVAFISKLRITTSDNERSGTSKKD